VSITAEALFSVADLHLIAEWVPIGHRNDVMQVALLPMWYGDEPIARGTGPLDIRANATGFSRSGEHRRIGIEVGPGSDVNDTYDESQPIRVTVHGNATAPVIVDQMICGGGLVRRS
jgi:hypothetical protein